MQVVEDREVETQALSGGGARGDDDVLTSLGHVPARPLVHPEAADTLGGERIGKVRVEVSRHLGRTSVAGGQYDLVLNPRVVFVIEDVEQFCFHAAEHPIQ